MYRALIIGAGNIGALYDLGTDTVLTYAKAFSLDREIIFDVYDTNVDSLERVQAHYECGIISDLNNIDYKTYELVVISTPTAFHYGYLVALLNAQVKLVICEKPVDTDTDRLSKLETLYAGSGSKVLVNYHRRFQEEIFTLKALIGEIQEQEKCTNILIKYQRGLHNNFSHALDLLTCLFDEAGELENIIVTSKVHDEFENDPTISFSCTWNNIHFQVVGLENVKFSFFEIEIFFEQQFLLLLDGCDTVEHHIIDDPNPFFYPKAILKSRKTSVLKNYMLAITGYAKKILAGETDRDNFSEAVSISKKILKITN